MYSNTRSCRRYKWSTRTWSLSLEKLFDKQTDMSSKEPGICTCFLNLAFKCPKIYEPVQPEKKNRPLYKTITPVLMVKILDSRFLCEKLLTKDNSVYVSFDLHLFGVSLEVYVFHKATLL